MSETTRPPLPRRLKNLVRLLHLWAGLVFGAILVVLGLSGSALAWIDEIDAWLNPALLQVAPPPGLAQGVPVQLPPASVQAALERLTRDPLYGRPAQLALPHRAGEVMVASYRIAAAGQSPWRLAVTRQVMLDPHTLRITGERHWGEAGLSRQQLMPTLFHVHRYLVAGEVGKTVIALCGVALLLLALTGLVLWWPRLAAGAVWHALTVRHGGSWPRFSFQLHRAAGFFSAPVLLMLAVSGVYFNMPHWVLPIVSALAPVTPPERPVNRSAPDAKRLSAAQAIEAAQAAYPQARVSRVALPAKSTAPFEIRLRQPGEVRQGSGSTRISIDAGDGAVLRVADPLRAPAGDTFLAWLFPLHTGEAFGSAGRVFISAFGLAPLMFFITGLVVWIKLRRAKPGKVRTALTARAPTSVSARTPRARAVPVPGRVQS